MYRTANGAESVPTSYASLSSSSPLRHTGTASAATRSSPLSVPPSTFRNATEALAGARLAARNMVMEHNFCVREEFGDHSDSERLRPSIPVSPSGGVGTGGVERRTFPERTGGVGGQRLPPPRTTTTTTTSFLPEKGMPTSPPSPQHKMTDAEMCKTSGNEAFEKGNYLQAIHHYTRGIEILEQSSTMEAKLRSGGVSEEAIYYHTCGGTQKRGGGGGGGYASEPSFAQSGMGSTNGEDTILLAALFSNRSASYLQGSKWVEAGVESAYDHALFDADKVTSLRPNWFKGYSRQGDCYFKMQRYHQAVESYAMAVSLDPGNTRLVHSLTEARDRAKEGSREEWKARRPRRAPQPDAQTSMHGGEEDLGTRGKPMGHGTTALHQDAYATQGNPTSTVPNPLREGQPSRGLWENLKKEVEMATQSPTGDEYRQAQLEKFRMQRSGGGSRESSLHSAFPGGGASGSSSMNASLSGSLSPLGGRTVAQKDGKSSEEIPIIRTSSSDVSPSLSPSGSGKDSHLPWSEGGGDPSSRYVPPEYSAAAAASYQQKLLENFRQKRKPM